MTICVADYTRSYYRSVLPLQIRLVFDGLNPDGDKVPKPPAALTPK